MPLIQMGTTRQARLELTQHPSHVYSSQADGNSARTVATRLSLTFDFQKKKARENHVSAKLRSDAVQARGLGRALLKIYIFRGGCALDNHKSILQSIPSRSWPLPVFSFVLSPPPRSEDIALLEQGSVASEFATPSRPSPDRRQLQNPKKKRGAPIPSLLSTKFPTEYVRSIFIPRRGEQPTFRTISLVSRLVTARRSLAFRVIGREKSHHLTRRHPSDCFSLSSLPRHGRRRGRRR